MKLRNVSQFTWAFVKWPALIPILFFLAFVAALLVAQHAAGQQAVQEPGFCPEGIKVCKIVPMTPEEIQTLTGKGMVFDGAIYSNRMGFESLVNAWKQKIEGAPAGKVKETPKK